MTSAAGSGWEFTAAYRLGQHWQQAGDYVRAQVAYSQALELEPKHRASRLNLAVTQIRLASYQAARENLDVLGSIEDLPLEPRARERLKPHALVVAYNRALVLRYLGELDQARQWSERVAVAAYKRHDDLLVGRLAPTALMLHAGILVEGLEDDDAGLDRAAEHALSRPEEADERQLVRDPAAIEWYVRRHLIEDRRPDARGRYNLACYLARLAQLVPGRADDLADRVIDESQVAFTDSRLVPWAARDPALEVMHGRPAWEALLQRQGATPATPPAGATDVANSNGAGPVDAVARRSPAVKRQRAIADAVALLADVHVDADERRARRTHDPLDRFEELASRAAGLGEAAFHAELTRAVAELRDPVTAYLAPRAMRERVAVLPLRLADGFDADGARRVFVSASEPWLAEAGLHAGTEVTQWNGAPIERVIEARAPFVAAADIEGRRARALATLTCRATGVLAPLDADEVTVGYGVDREIRVEWEHGHSGPAVRSGGLGSVDPLVAAITRIRSPDAGIAVAEVDGGGGAWCLRIPSFEVADPEAFVAALVAELDRLPSSGLVLDVRGNGGGSIAAAERMLQLFSSQPVAPHRVQLRATERTAQIARDVPELRRWSRSIDRALGRGDPFSDALPVSSDEERACNRIGRRYAGPVVLLIDALSAGATDLFVAGFADRALGPVLSTAARGGMAGGVAWRTDDRDGALPRPLRALPDGAAFQLSVARMLRARGPRPATLAEHPVAVDRIRRPLASEVAAGDAGLLREAAELLRSSWTPPADA